jgi:antitoxin ParD1/3/4
MMTVEIPLNYQAFVKTIIERGQFQTEEQVVGEALRLLAERDQRLAEFRREVQIGLHQLDRGENTEYDEESLKEVFEQIEAEEPDYFEVQHEPD